MNDINIVFEYLHQIDPVQMEPQTRLTHWQLIKVRDSDNKFTRHLSGLADGEGRASTEIMAMDVVGLRATTRSGRVYVLERPGFHGDAAWVFAQWLAINQCMKHSDQTRALLRLRSRIMNKAKSNAAQLTLCPAA